MSQENTNYNLSNMLDKAEAEADEWRRIAQRRADKLSEATEEIERLKRWKEESIVVFNEWEKVWTAAGSPGTLGASKAKAVWAKLSKSES